MLQIKMASRYDFAVTQEYLVGYRQHDQQGSKNADRIYKSWLRTLELVREEFERVPEQAIAWKLGELHFAAATRAYAGSRFRKALWLMFLAAYSDPAGVPFLLGRFGKERTRHLAGRLKRALVPVNVAVKRSPFLEARPDEVVPPSNSGLHRRRLEYLRRLDEMPTPRTYALKAREGNRRVLNEATIPDHSACGDPARRWRDERAVP
jgi:hypothetical protein